MDKKPDKCPKEADCKIAEPDAEHHPCNVEYFEKAKKRCWVPKSKRI